MNIGDGRDFYFILYVSIDKIKDVHEAASYGGTNIVEERSTRATTRMPTTTSSMKLLGNGVLSDVDSI